MEGYELNQSVLSAKDSPCTRNLEDQPPLFTMPKLAFGTWADDFVARLCCCELRADAIRGILRLVRRSAGTGSAILAVFFLALHQACAAELSVMLEAPAFATACFRADLFEGEVQALAMAGASGAAMERLWALSSTAVMAAPAMLV